MVEWDSTESGGLMRNTVIGLTLALLIVGAFMALDRTTLHWYTSNERGQREMTFTAAPPNAVSPTRTIARTEAEEIARNHLQAIVDAEYDDVRIDLCNGVEQYGTGWFVQCPAYTNQDETSFWTFIRFVDSEGKVAMAGAP